MATILLVVIYISFLGIGIPDSLFGAAWPAIYQEFGVPVSMANYITVIVAAGTVVSSLFSGKVIGFLGTSGTVAISTLMTAAALLAFSCCDTILPLCLCAIPLGLGAGSIDTALNNYVALHYRASHMSYLHCIGNAGTFLSPFLMSFALAALGNWRSGYRIMFCVQLVIGLATVASLPLWKRSERGAGQEDSIQSRTLTVRQVLGLPSMGPILCMFFTSCAIEFTCGLWGSTYLVESRGLPVEDGALYTAIYYLGMTLGRFLSGLLAPKIPSWRLTLTGERIVCAALVVLLLPLPAAFSALGLFLVGLGNGPVFPNLTHLIPKFFGPEVSRSVMGIQLSVANTGILLTPALFGFLAQQISPGLFPWYILILASALAMSTAAVKKPRK